MLQAQEDAPAFDIHDYSDRFLSRVGSLVRRPQPKAEKRPDPSRISFYDAAQGQPPAEMCRMFLACLQLANMGNVEVLPGAPKTLEGSNIANTNGKEKGGGGRWGFDLRLVCETRRTIDVDF
jgi:hypothetical protein